jgi:hypothetical protein
MTNNILGHLIHAQIAQHEENIKLLEDLMYRCHPLTRRNRLHFVKAINKQQKLIKRLQKYV